MTIVEPLEIAMTSYYLPSESKIGAGWMAHRLANALCARGHHVTMFSPCSKPVDALYEHQPVRIRGRLRTFRWGWRVRMLDLSGFDVLHCHGDDHLVRAKAAPVHVRTMHGSCFDEALHATGLVARVRMLLLGGTELISALRFRDVVGVSSASLRWFPWRTKVIPNGVDLERFTPGGARETVPTILFVGTYERRKRGKLLLDVFEREILPKLPQARLWMVCDDAPDAPGVEVLGRLTDDELAERYRRAWIFCLPSSYEGFGVPYIEAMASGLPVVATPNRGAREVLQDGKLGVLADPEDLGWSLVAMLDDPEARRTYADQGLQAIGAYSWDTIAAQYEDLYAAQLERHLAQPRGRV
jgi:phosphatidylinositol alpha-mannosyltransferase